MELLAVAFIFSFILTVFIAYIYHKYVYRLHKCLEKFPGPTPKLLTGTAYTVKGISSTEYFDVASQMTKQYGPVVKHSLGLLWPTRVGLLISDPNLIELILSSPRVLKKTPNYYFMRRWLQDGLILSTGPKWKQRRKIIAKTFSNQILQEFIGIFNSATRVLVQKLEKEEQKGTESTDIYELITLCALDIICETAMGTHVDAQNDTESKYVFCVEEMRRIITSRAVSILKLFDGTYPFFVDYYKEQKAIKVLHSYSDFIINKRRSELLEKHCNNEDDKSTKQCPFLDVLLSSSLKGKPLLKHKEIRAEVNTLIFAGYDTTASAVSFALYCLANDVEIQEKAVREITEIFKDHPNRPATYKDLQEMKYLEMIIKETLRLYPPAPVVGRELEEDLQTPDGSILPKGLYAAIFAYGVHRNPQIWPEPTKFDPDRFLAKNSSERHPFAYLPFGAGARSCIGQKYAMLEIKAILSEILRNFELHPAVPEHKLLLVPEIVLKSTNGVRIHLKKRFRKAA